MRPNKKTIALLGIASAICISITYLYILPIVRTVSTDLNAYATRIAYRDNYKLHTTPLSSDVVDDICSKLGIKVSSENCGPNAEVYAPDFFDEIKAHFRNVSAEDKTYANVQDILGAYLAYCEEPHPSGDYRCRYDLRGDQRYFVFIWFDKDNFYYHIMANTGGS
jgi:hypothetical protein